MTLLFELLVGIKLDLFTRPLVFVDVIDDNLRFFRRCVCHDEVLVESSRQHRVSAVVDVFANYIYASRCPTKESWLLPIDTLKSLRQSVEPFLLFLEGCVVLAVDIV